MDMKAIKKVYDKSPHLIQNFLVSLEGLKRYFERLNNNYFRKYEEMLESPPNADKYQMEKLKKFINSAYENSIYWSEELNKLNYKRNQEITEEFIRDLPILNKELIQQSKSKFLNATYKPKELIKATTSGTSGSGFVFNYTKEAYASLFAFFWKVCFHQNKFGDKYGTFNGNIIVPYERIKSPFWRKNIVSNQTIFSIFHMKEDNFNYYYKELKENSYKFLNGYPSAIYLIADYIVRNNLNKIKLDAIYTSSETLLDHQRKTIENAFQCKVYDLYSNGEQSALIYQNSKGEYVVSKYFSYVWFKETDIIIEDQKAYKLIGTSFINDSIYFINYDIGDLVLLNKNKSIKKIIGRIEDFVITKDGRKIGRLDHLFKDASDVKEAQIIQKDYNNLVIKIVLNGSEFYSKANVLSEIKNRLGTNFDVSFQFVNKIERTSNGKLKFVISEL